MDEVRLARFLAKIEKLPDGCWLWRGARSNHPRNNYGLFRDTPTTERRVHRLAYEHFVGPLIDGMVIHHICENTLCVNPDHLEQVTPAEHLFRSPRTITSINAARTHCPQGHEYNAVNTRIERDGARKCRVCDRDRAREKRRRQREERG